MCMLVLQPLIPPLTQRKSKKNGYSTVPDTDAEGEEEPGNIFT